MTDQTTSELIILFMLIISNARIFQKNQVKSDAVSIIPLIAFILSLFSILAWGISLEEIVVLCLAFFAFIWNIRALLRLKEHLVIDHYSGLFISISIINLLLSLAAAVFIFIYRPVKLNPKKFSVTETVFSYKGNFTDGFEEDQNLFSMPNLKLHKFQNQQNNEQKPVVIFIPEKCSDTAGYRPFLFHLSQMGYTVYAGDFFNAGQDYFSGIQDFSLLRKFVFIKTKITSPEEYSEIITSKNNFLEDEYRALFNLVMQQEKSDCGIIFIGDETEAVAAEKVCNADSRIYGIVDISKVSGYSTPGWGPVEQTAPLIAKYLGFSRDKSLYMSAHLAHAADSSMNKFTEQKTK